MSKLLGHNVRYHFERDGKIHHAAAIVVGVNPDDTVNLAVFVDEPESRTPSVTYGFVEVGQQMERAIFVPHAGNYEYPAGHTWTSLRLT